MYVYIYNRYACIHIYIYIYTQTTSQSHPHTQVRVQPRNTYNHTYIKFLPGQKNILLNPDKTTCTLFTPDPAEYTNTTSITSPTQTHNILQHPKAKQPLFSTTAATQQTFHRPNTVTTTDITTNMRHIHISIVSRHLATRGNNKILRAPPPYISMSEEILHHTTRRTLAQLRKN